MKILALHCQSSLADATSHRHGSRTNLSLVAEGDYDIVIPCNVNTGEYKIRIGVFDDDSTFDCSDTFIILGSSAISSEDEDLSMSFRFMF